MDDRNPGSGASQPVPPPGADLRHRPGERFWPYADLSETPADEDLSALDPALAAALSPVSTRPFSVTVVFPPLDTPDYDRAVELARQSAEYRTVGVFHRARFLAGDVVKLHELWLLIGGFDSVEVLIDDRPLPYARQLWLPLMWFLIRG